MKKTFEHKVDIIDALNDIQTQVDFVAYAIDAMHEQGDKWGSVIQAGLSLTLDQIKNQIGEVNEEIEKNIYEVAEITIEKVADLKKNEKGSGAKMRQA